MKVTTIFGPPGTGKTRKLVDHVKEEEQGLFLSYTKAAATEAVSRLHGNIVRPSTIHSLAFNQLGMNRASVVDKRKLAQFAQATGIPFKGSDGSDEEQEGDQYLQVLSYARNVLCGDLIAYDRFGCPGTRARFERFIAEYESWKKTYGYMDFDDMLTLYSRNGRGVAGVVFLDEAQDCTPLQWSAFERAVEKAKRVYIAGDDDQAIYEWNGANPSGMMAFTRRYEGEFHVLDQSHRLTEPVYLKALSVIETVADRVEKNFKPKGPGPDITHYRDLDFVIDRLDAIAPKGALILVRDRFKVDEIKRALNREMIPYDVYGGISPWTSVIARAIRAGEITKGSDDIPISWRSFYREADLTLPIKYHLSTIHSAKGREHETVIMDFDMPNRVLLNCQIDPDAEARVQYVGLTRTKNLLVTCGDNPLQ